MAPLFPGVIDQHTGTSVLRRKGTWTLAALAVAIIVHDPLRKLFPTLLEEGQLLVHAATLLVYCAALSNAPEGRATSDRRLLLVGLAPLGAWVILSIIFDWRNLTFLAVAVHTYFFFPGLAWAIPRILRSVDASLDRSLSTAGIVVGGLVSLTALGSVLEAGRVFEPIVDQVGIHSFGYQAVDLEPGIFATGERLARLCLLPLFLATAMMFSRSKSFLLPMACALASLMAVVLSGKRFGILLAALGVFGLALFARSRLVARWGFIGLTTIAGTILITSGSLFADFVRSGLGESQFRTDVALTISEVSLYGQGAGTYSQGRPYEVSALRPEGNLDRLATELGIPGLLLGLFLGAICFWIALKGVRRGFQSHSTLLVGASAYVIALLLWSLKQHPTFGDPSSLAGFWICMGLLLTRYQVDVSQRAADRARLE